MFEMYRLSMNKKHNEARKKHNTKEYMAWTQMRARCFTKSRPDYDRYGGRGITVCERWNDYKNFLLDMGRAPSSRHSLDRVDTNGNYQPSNCRWATHKQQANNRRSSRFVTIGGVSHTLAEWAEIKRVKHRLITVRIWRGWDPVEAITTPVGPRHRPEKGYKWR